jgi:hypothetical protein
MKPRPPRLVKECDRMEKPFPVGTFVWFEDGYGCTGLGVIADRSDPPERWARVNWIIPPRLRGEDDNWYFRADHPDYDIAVGWGTLTFAASTAQDEAPYAPFKRG